MTEQQTRSTLDRLIGQPITIDHDAGTDTGTLYAVTWTAGPHDRYARPVVIYLRNGPIIPWHSVNRIRHADDAAPGPSLADRYGVEDRPISSGLAAALEHPPR